MLDHCTVKLLCALAGVIPLTVIATWGFLGPRERKRDSRGRFIKSGNAKVKPVENTSFIDTPGPYPPGAA